MQVAVPRVVRCWEAAHGLMEASLEHRDSYSPGTELDPQLGKVTMWSEQQALPRKALGLFSEEKNSQAF